MKTFRQAKMSVYDILDRMQSQDKPFGGDDPVPTDIDSTRNDGLTFDYIKEHSDSWEFYLNTIHSIITFWKRHWNTSSEGSIVISKASKAGEIIDSTHFIKNPLIDSFPRPHLWFAFHKHIYRTRLKASIHRFLSKIDVNNGNLEYDYFGLVHHKIAQQEIVCVASLMLLAGSTKDWFLVVVQKNKKVLFVPVNAKNFISFWTKFKVSFPPEIMRLSISGVFETESYICFPKQLKYEEMFKKIQLKRGLFSYLMRTIGYYQF
ncbi:MAG: hypothetical protein ACKVTZ_05715 [Bacteroidia bacterium]